MRQRPCGEKSNLLKHSWGTFREGLPKLVPKYLVNLIFFNLQKQTVVHCTFLQSLQKILPDMVHLHTYIYIKWCRKLLVPAPTVISLVGKVDSTKKKKDKIKCLQVTVSLKENDTKCWNRAKQRSALDKGGLGWLLWWRIWAGTQIDWGMPELSGWAGMEMGEAALPRPEVSETQEKHECGQVEWALKGQLGPGDRAPCGSWWEVDFLF